MASAYCVNLEDPIYGSGVSFKNSVLEAHMGSTEGDNNDGITVFDVTDPANPTYCFVSTFGLEAAEEVKSRVPLSAEQYCRAYYPIPHDEEKEKEGVKETEEDVKRKIDALSNERLMTLDVLAEAWPEEYQSSSTTKSEPAESKSSPSNPIPALADLSLKPAIKHGVETGETEELEELAWHPGKAQLMKPILRDLKPFPESGMALLTKVLQHEWDVGKAEPPLDLAGFAFSDSQLISVLKKFPGVEAVELLDLSSTSITVDTLRQLLPTMPKLRRLILLDTSIDNETLYKLLEEEPKLFITLEELIHPAFLSWQDTADYPNAFAYVGVHSSQYACSASLPVFTPASVIQCLTDLLGPIVGLSAYEAYGVFGTSLVPQAAFATGVRKEGQPWSERRVHCFPALLDRPFNGKGWLFAATWASMFDQSPSRFGFVSVDPSSTPPKTRILDLKGWLAAMEAEGRPPASEAAVKKLEQIFDDLCTKQEALLWTEKDFPAFAEAYTKRALCRY
ncbi:hypothetical protein R3P38DRAFT_3302794 [Favolaschia claudopus]|uniref:Uncharacterized protein n=1 Tax=Favolaschia claudopus TaxID=2862362 RepID=A0AAW0EBP1_9AGAR